MHERQRQTNFFVIFVVFVVHSSTFVMPRL